jgi:hypothetical protein
MDATISALMDLQRNEIITKDDADAIVYTMTTFDQFCDKLNQVKEVPMKNTNDTIIDAMTALDHFCEKMGQVNERTTNDEMKTFINDVTVKLKSAMAKIDEDAKTRR